MKHLEAAHQQQVIEWARMASKSQAGIAKSQGMLSGVPDLFFASATRQMLVTLFLFVIVHKKQSSVLKIITKTD